VPSGDRLGGGGRAPGSPRRWPDRCFSLGRGGPRKTVGRPLLFQVTARRIPASPLSRYAQGRRGSHPREKGGGGRAALQQVLAPRLGAELEGTRRRPGSQPPSPAGSPPLGTGPERSPGPRPSEAFPPSAKAGPPEGVPGRRESLRRGVSGDSSLPTPSGRRRRRFPEGAGGAEKQR